MLKDRNLKLKAKFLKYYADLPIQNLACAYIGKHQDTILDWKNKDPDFSDRIDEARAKWAQSNVKGVKSKEWMLERVMNDHFGNRIKSDVTSGGKPIAILDVTNVLQNVGDKETTNTNKED